MNPIPLTMPDGSIGYYACEQCSRVHEERVEAEECCLCPDCKSPDAPNAYYGDRRCRECYAAKRERDNTEYKQKRAAEKAEHYAAAKKIPLAEYKGEMVCFGNAYDPEDYRHTSDLDASADEDWAFGTTVKKAAWDLTDALKDALENEHYEGAFDWVDGKKLAEAQLLINEAIANVRSYEADFGTVVIIREAE